MYVKWQYGEPIEGNDTLPDIVLQLQPKVGYILYPPKCSPIWQWHHHNESGYVMMHDDPNGDPYTYWENAAIEHLRQFPDDVPEYDPNYVPAVSPHAPPEPEA